MTEIGRPSPSWLNGALSGWVSRYGQGLADVFRAFNENGAWPDPSVLQRRLAQREPPVVLELGPGGIPRDLGGHTYSPDEFRLSLLGLGCVPESAELLDLYVEVIQLAVRLYRDDTAEPRISREDVEREIAPSAALLDRVSILLLGDHAFLGSGRGEADDWSYEINGAIMPFLQVTDRDALLKLLASQRLAADEVARPASTSGPKVREPDELAEIHASIRAGVPAAAVESYARWWQLETFLRELVYVELRTKYGPSWGDRLDATTHKRAITDSTVNEYMATGDAEHRLAYTDPSALFDLIDNDWNLFENSLLPKARWAGRRDELNALRRRVAHCRRPHQDDGSRLRQTLRDLEVGGKRFYSSYLSTRTIPADSEHPLAIAWAAGKHPTARRLLDHTPDRYGVNFGFRYSRRPWSKPDSTAEPFDDPEGLIWHASWQTTRRDIDLAVLWERIANRPRYAKAILHLLFDGSTLVATFPGLAPTDVVADAIGHIYDNLLMSLVDPPAWNDEIVWPPGPTNLPTHVQTGTTLALLDPSLPFSLFSAQSP